MVRFDHALIYVADLGAAVRDYGALGFTVIPGGAHKAGPTENALVPFADGSYFELIAFRRRATHALLVTLARLGLVGRVVRAPLARRFSLRAARGSGLVDFAVCVDDAPTIVERARRSGVTVHGPIAGRRAAADGTPVAWQLAIPAADDLPLIISDVTPRPLRAAATRPVHHANGVIGVAGVVLPVGDVAGASARFRDVLELAACADGDARRVELGTTRLMLVPAPADSPGRPSRVVLTADGARRLDVRLAHGAVLDLA